jgi:hypothetical protein
MPGGRLKCLLALIALLGVAGCSAGPETAFETAYSVIGLQVK